jgi:cephalosporin-C deacetylase-like acetyl esterase
VGFTSALSFERRRSPRPLKEWFVSNLDEALGTSVHDVQMILNYLASRSDIDMGRIGMFGQGSGGAIAALAAAVDPRIAVLDLLNPWGDWPDWLKDSPQIPEDERADYLKPDFIKKVAGLDPIDYIAQLRVRALRIQQIKDDPVTPASSRKKIAAATPAPDVVEWFQDEEAHVAVWRTEGLSGWIRKQLSSGAN